MYPEGTFLNASGDNILVIFEKDIENPENEGFVCYWEFDGQNTYKLIFKKRLSKQKAIEKIKNLLKEGWKKIFDECKVA